MFTFIRRALDAFYRPEKLYVAYDYRPRKKHAGPPIVFLHGIASSSADFEAIKESLPSNRRCIFIDLLGHGKSPVPKKGYDIDSMTRHLDVTLRDLGVVRPVIVGYSMGAMIAIRYAAIYKNSSQVVACSMPLYSYESKSSILHKVTTKLYETLQTRQNFTLGLAKIISVIQADRSGMNLTQENWQAFYESMQYIVMSYNPLRDARRLSHFCMIVGQLDIFVSIDATHEFADNVGGVKVFVAKSGFHVMNSSYDRLILGILHSTENKGE